MVYPVCDRSATFWLVKEEKNLVQAAKTRTGTYSLTFDYLEVKSLSIARTSLQLTYSPSLDGRGAKLNFTAFIFEVGSPCDGIVEAHHIAHCTG